MRSLISKYEQIEAILDEGKIDILSLSESWLNKNITNTLIRANGYKIYRLDRTRKCRGGGICVYVHSKYKVDAQVHENLSVSNKDAELLVLHVEQKCTTPYVLISVYRPPQGNQTQFIESLGETLNQLSRVGARNIVVVGDVNSDILFKRENKIVKDLKVMQQEFALKQLIKASTRTTSSCQSLIDHIYTNVNIDMIADSGVLEETISDHNPVYCIIKLEQTRNLIRPERWTNESKSRFTLGR